MRKVKALFVVVGIALAALGVVQARQTPGRGPATLTGVDYAEIQRIYARYAQGYDLCAEQGMAWARVFTPDGVFVAGGRVIEGRQKLAEFAKCPDGVARRPTQHWMSNPLITPSAEGATGSAYVMQVNTIDPKLSTSGGRYEDVFVKGPEGWAIKKRTYIPPTRPAAATPPE